MAGSMTEAEQPKRLKLLLDHNSNEERLVIDSGRLFGVIPLDIR